MTAPLHPDNSPDRVSRSGEDNNPKNSCCYQFHVASNQNGQIAVDAFSSPTNEILYNENYGSNRVHCNGTARKIPVLL